MALKTTLAICILLLGRLAVAEISAQARPDSDPNKTLVRFEKDGRIREITVY